MIAKTPAALFDYLFLAPNSAASQAKLLTALGQTLPMTIVGMAIGLAFAFALALGSVLFPAIIRGLHAGCPGDPDHAAGGADPAARADARPRPVGDPLDHGFSDLLPRFRDHGAGGFPWCRGAALDVPKAYGAGPLKQLRFVSIPASAALSLRRDTACRSARAARRHDRRMARHRHRPSANCSTSHAATSTTA